MKLEEGEGTRYNSYCYGDEIKRMRWTEHAEYVRKCEVHTEV